MTLSSAREVGGVMGGGVKLASKSTKDLLIFTLWKRTMGLRFQQSYFLIKMFVIGIRIIVRESFSFTFNKARG